MCATAFTFINYTRPQMNIGRTIFVRGARSSAYAIITGERERDTERGGLDIASTPVIALMVTH